MLSRTKACALPYKWPLLADGQDPDALEARLAYHLHRLQLTGAPLREALKGNAYLATALSQGRASIDRDFVAELATNLNIGTDELLREVLNEEARDWSFYRTSALARRDVWNAIENHIKSNNITQAYAAEALRIDRQKLVDNIHGRRQAVLDRSQIQNLLEATNSPFDPERWLTHASANRGNDPQISTPEV